MRGCTAGVATAALLAVLLAGPTPGHGTAFNPLTTSDECSSEAVLSAGATVYLFHGGAGEAIRSIRTGEILVVTSSRGIGRGEEVGRIRVDAPAGALCFRGEVIEGNLRPHDVARAGPVFLLVITTDAPCLREAER